MKNLIIYPGNGKTGSTSIKEYMKINHDKLLNQGIYYLGMSFENINKSTKYEKLSSLKHYLGEQIEENPDKICEFSVDQINHAIKSKKLCHTFIWINESLINQYNWFVNHFKKSLDSISSFNIKYKIIYGIRDPSEYAISAFLQWGENNKFKDFVLNELQSKYENCAKGWLKAGDDFTVICKRKEKNIIVDFLKNINFKNDLPVPNIHENVTSSKSNYSEHNVKLYLEQLNNDEELIEWVKIMNIRYNKLLKYQLPDPKN